MSEILQLRLFLPHLLPFLSFISRLSRSAPKMNTSPRPRSFSPSDFPPTFPDLVFCSSASAKSRPSPLGLSTSSLGHLAIEMLLTALEKAKEATSSPDETLQRLKLKELLPKLIKRIFSALLNTLLHVVDDPVWHRAKIGTDYENAGESTNFQAGQEFLDRLANSLGGENIFSVAQELLLAYISNEDWSKRHATLICVAQMAEGCAKLLTKNPDPTFNMVINSFKDENPKVRWAAINAIGQMSTDISPLL